MKKGAEGAEGENMKEKIGNDKRLFSHSHMIWHKNSYILLIILAYA